MRGPEKEDIATAAQATRLPQREGTGGKAAPRGIRNPWPVFATRKWGRAVRIRLGHERSRMLMLFRKRRPAILTLRGWAIAVLQEAAAIRECEEHGWLKDRGDPDTRGRALAVAHQAPPPDISPDEAVSAVQDVLGSIGDTCPECPPEV
jgi:hypothetical protein